MNIFNSFLILIGFASLFAIFWIANFRVLPSRKGKFYNNIKQIKTIMVIFLCVFLLSGAMSLQEGLNEYGTYMSHKNSFVPVTATVVDVQEETDSDGNTDYNVYVKYQYNEQTVSRVFWKSTTKAQYRIGEQIPIEISSKDITYINKNAGGQFTVVLALIFFAHSVYIVSEFLIKRCKTENYEQYILSEKMVIHDIRPKNINLFYKLFLAFGSALMCISFLEADVFTTAYEFVGLLFVILSVIFGYLVVKKTIALYRDGVKISRRQCLQRHSDRRGDDDVTFTHFEGHKVIQGTVGTVGRTYYIVGDFKNLYDDEFFVLDSSEEEKNDVVKEFIKRFVIDGVLICAASCAFANGVYYIMH